MPKRQVVKGSEGSEIGSKVTDAEWMTQGEEEEFEFNTSKADIQ